MIETEDLLNVIDNRSIEEIAIKKFWKIAFLNEPFQIRGGGIIEAKCHTSSDNPRKMKMVLEIYFDKEILE